MKKFFYFLFLVLIISATSSLVYSQATSIPPSFMQVLKSKGLDKKYVIEQFMAPSYLQADLNGDKQADVVVFVMNAANKKKGILLIHGITKEVNIFGAGKNFGNGSDDFSWVAKWNINHKNKKGVPAIEIMDANDIGGLIKWNGKKYTWVQQGD